jgi:hypothetical protein
MGWVYLIRNGDLHKIGRTDNLQQRLKQLDPDEVIQVLETDRSRDLEHELHKEFQTKRLPQSEYFRLDEAEINAARIALGWDPEGPVVLPEIPAVREARAAAHLALGAVAVTVMAFVGEGVLLGRVGLGWDALIALVAVPTWFGLLAASAALLWFSLRFAWTWLTHRQRRGA